MHRPVINAHNRLRAVAPEMAGSQVFAVLLGKRFLRRGTGEHFFGAQMFAEAGAHT
jgi:ribosomal protein S19